MGVWSCVLCVLFNVHRESFMCDGIGGLYFLWRGELAKELFMSKHGRMGSGFDS